MIYYQDENLYYFRKPAGIPSSFGKTPSFLDLLLTPLTGSPLGGEMSEGQRGWTGGLTGVCAEACQHITRSLLAFFGTEKELWLLNRLDNETSGLLYFAKNPRVYKKFKQMQSAFLLNKYYLAEVYGDITSLISPQITLPLAHHRFNPDRMVAIKQPSDVNKTKWTLHHLTTKIVEFQFLPASNTSILLLRIQKGLRHQIRAHLSAVGYPICGDKLYSKSDHKNYDTLQLFSVGLES